MTGIDIKEEFSIYAAGFFDGEGCIHVSHQSGYDYIQITIAQRHPALMAAFRDRWGGSLHIAKDGCCFWRLSKGKDCKRFLTSIAPYTRLKQTELQIALAFLNVGSSYGNLTNQLIKCRLSLKLGEAANERRAEAEVCDNSDR